nr:MAG TPA: hypothetical protein [Bacteriophage sp.]
MQCLSGTKYDRKSPYLLLRGLFSVVSEYVIKKLNCAIFYCLMEICYYFC